MANQFALFDVSGAVQSATSWLLKQANEVYDSENLRYDVQLGSAERRPGYSLFLELAAGKFPLGFFEAKFRNSTYLMFAYNNSGDTATVLSAYDPITTNITTVKNDYPPNCKLQMVMNGGEMYVAGITTDTGARQPIINVQENLTVSDYRNVFTAPKAAFIGENSGVLYAMNVEMADGKIYPDRAYVSSPQKGAITYVNAAMNNTYAPVDLVLQTPKMTSNTAPFGVAAASSIANTSNDAWAAFERTSNSTANNTRWLSVLNTLTGWVRYDFGSGNSKVINYYTVSAAGPQANLNRGPKTWTLQGSNDASAWTTLDTETNVPAWTSVGETRMYAMSNTTAYRYYRINITANQGATDYVAISELGLYSTVQTSREMQIKVDSARYVKPGMPIDFYKAGTDTYMFTVTPTTVDKSKDTFNFLPYQQTVTSVTAASDLIAVPDATKFPTGTEVYFQSTGAVPTGLTAGTTYYAIQIDATNIKVAGSKADALIGAAIDLTAAGSGVITIGQSYNLEKTDELWLAGRKNDITPSTLWNVDYRTPQTADFVFIASGKVADTAITGWAKSNNRLNIFTKTSMWQYDNANFLPIFEDVGCISHDTICNNGTWLIWLDAMGRVRARDSNSGEDQIISRAMKNRYLGLLSASSLQNASAVMFDSNYKLDVGTLDGKMTRLVYNFDMNVWWREAHKRRHVYGLNSSISGTRKSYFLDETGRMFLDEDGDLDWSDTIPWYIRYGRNNFGNGLTKSLIGMYVHSENSSGSVVFTKTSNKQRDWQKVGQLTELISELPIQGVSDSRDFDFKISGNAKGAAARIDGIEVWFDAKQSNF
jgi:hypothetical protein